MRLFAWLTPGFFEKRRLRVERPRQWHRRLLTDAEYRPPAILLLGAALAGWAVNLGDDVSPHQAGQYLHRALTARVDFRLEDRSRTEDMRRRARDNADVFYRLDASLLQEIRGRLTNAARVAREQAANPPEVQRQAAEIKVLLDEPGLAALIALVADTESAAYSQAVERAVEVLRRAPLVGAEELALRRTGQNAILQDVEQETRRAVPVNKLRFATDAEEVQRIAADAAAEFPPALRPSITASLLLMLRREKPDSFQPLYRYDPQQSAQAAAEAEAAVPPQYVEYPIGTRLTDVGLVSPDEADLLRAEHQAYLAWIRSDANASRTYLLSRVARGVMTALLVLGLGGYVIVHYRSSLGSSRRRRATALTLLAVVVLARAALLHTPFPHLAVGAHALAVALMALTAVRGVANVTAVLLAVVITVATRQGAAFVIVLICVSMVLLFGLRDVRNRGRIILVGTFAAATAAVATLLVGLVDGQPLGWLLKTQALWAGLATLAAAFLVEGILPLIERLFGVTTNMTLLEWCDPNKPLLRMLAAEAPGTYNHSLMVGTLADAAAEAIGANGLLARTGAYYHDIGKINKSEYFVENQGLGMGNRHDRLSPAMSHLIIIGHVKDGIEMAKAYGLPVSLHPFIPEHHGTCVVEYFFHAANQARKPGDPEVSDTHFRYPGPKPRSRETAIVMICDAVEGSVRAMPEPTPGRIEDTVARVIRKRMMDGQFDECDLTFRELDIIHKSLVKSLNSIYHGRIIYPTQEEPTPEEERSERPEPRTSV